MARSRQRGIATNEIGLVSVILLVVGVLAYRGCSGRTDSALDCVGISAVRRADVALELKCPVSGAPFVASVCPDPNRHLRWPPRFDRGRSQQDLPEAPKTASLEIGRKASYITARENGSTVIVDVRPRIWWRYIVGPLVQLLCVVYIVAFFFQLSPKDRGPTGVVVTSLVVMLLSIWLLWITVPTVEGSRALQFDPVAGRVLRHRYLFGKELSPEVYETTFSPVMVRTLTGWTESHSIVLIQERRGAYRSIELIDGLSEKDAVLGSWLRSRFPK
jgi:hypothetical protein